MLSSANRVIAVIMISFAARVITRELCALTASLLFFSPSLSSSIRLLARTLSRPFVPPFSFSPLSPSLYFSSRLTNSQLRHARPRRVKRNFWSLHACVTAAKGRRTPCAPIHHGTRPHRARKPFLASPAREKTAETKTGTGRGLRAKVEGGDLVPESIRTSRKRSGKPSRCYVNVFFVFFPLNGKPSMFKKRKCRNHIQSSTGFGYAKDGWLETK